MFAFPCCFVYSNRNVVRRINTCICVPVVTAEIPKQYSKKDQKINGKKKTEKKNHNSQIPKKLNKCLLPPIVSFFVNAISFTTFFRFFPFFFISFICYVCVCVCPQNSNLKIFHIQTLLFTLFTDHLSCFCLCKLNGTELSFLT